MSRCRWCGCPIRVKYTHPNPKVGQVWEHNNGETRCAFSAAPPPPSATGEAQR